MAQRFGLAQLDDQLFGNLERPVLAATDLAHIHRRVTGQILALEVFHQPNQFRRGEPFVVQPRQRALGPGPHRGPLRRHISLLIPTQHPLSVADIGQFGHLRHKWFICIAHNIRFPV